MTAPFLSALESKCCFARYRRVVSIAPARGSCLGLLRTHEQQGDQDATRRDPYGAEERQPEPFDERNPFWHRPGERLRAGSREWDQDGESEHGPICAAEFNKPEASPCSPPS